MNTEEPLLLAPDPRSVRKARRHVETTLAQVGRPEWAEDAALAVSELVTNVVLHARTACEVSVRVAGDAALVRVRDFSPTPPIPRQLSRLAGTGRGLTLVPRIAADWGVEPLGADGKVVWFVLNGHAGADPSPKEGRP